MTPLHRKNVSEIITATWYGMEFGATGEPPMIFGEIWEHDEYTSKLQKAAYFDEINQL